MRCAAYCTSVMHQIIHFATDPSYLRTQNVLKFFPLPTNVYWL